MPALPATVRHETQVWLERCVIGLNLCPFAKSVHVKGQVHYVVSEAREPQQLAQDLERELLDLVASPPEARDTTLLIAPYCLQDFADFNDFLDHVDASLLRLDLDGVLQVASLHPAYQFAGTQADDITNYTNRSPYPTLHLLREDSVDRAVAAFPNAESIFETNMATLEKLGHEGWQALFSAPPSSQKDQEEKP